MATSENQQPKSIEAFLEEDQTQRGIEFGDALSLSAHPALKDMAFWMANNQLTAMGAHHA